MTQAINIGISAGILVLFVLVIVVGYVYVEQTRQTQDRMNQTLTQVMGQFEVKQIKDNMRFNATLNGLSKTYNLIIGNQRLIIYIANKSNYNQENIIDHFDNITNKLIWLTDAAQNNSAKNLNLTIFNRAMLADSNHILKQLAERFNLSSPLNR